MRGLPCRQKLTEKVTCRIAMRKRSISANACAIQKSLIPAERLCPRSVSRTAQAVIEIHSRNCITW